MTTFQELKRRKLVQWALAYLAGARVQQRLGASTAAGRTLEEARGRLTMPIGGHRGFPALAIAAVGELPEEAAAALSEYANTGGRDARWIVRNPLFDRVRDHLAFLTELERLEELLARQRRQVEHNLARE